MTIIPRDARPRRDPQSRNAADRARAEARRLRDRERLEREWRVLLGPLKEQARKRQEAAMAAQPRDVNGHFQPVRPELSGPVEESGRAVDHASKIVGVGKTTVQNAKAVRP